MTMPNQSDQTPAAAAEAGQSPFIPAQQGPAQQGPAQAFVIVQNGPGRRGPAITSMVLGIIAAVLCLVPIINNLAAVLAVIGFVFGVVAWRGARKATRDGKGMAIAGVVLAIVSMVGVIGSQYAYGRAVDSVSKDLNRSFGGATQDVLAHDLNVSFGTYRTTDSGFGLREGVLMATLTNKSNKRQSFDVKVEAVTASGARIDTDTGYVSDLNPGQSDEVSLFQFESDTDMSQLPTATFNVIEASAY